MGVDGQVRSSWMWVMFCGLIPLFICSFLPYILIMICPVRNDYLLILQVRKQIELRMLVETSEEASLVAQG